MEWLVWGTLVLTILVIVAAFAWTQWQQARVSALPVITQGLPDFALTNQNGQAITSANLLGQVWVADVIFTQCPGPCPKMTERMAELQTALPLAIPVKLVTLTTAPEHDRPAVLKRYGERFKAQFDRWMFLTGSKQQIALLARQGLKLVTEETKPEDRVSDEDLFLHSTVFVIVDKHGRLRGSFDSTEPDFQRKILSAIKSLAREK